MDTETTKAGDTVDLIAYRRRGATQDVTEAIYKLNPGLAAYGVVLPAGLKVVLPDAPKKVAIRKNVKRIWS